MNFNFGEVLARAWQITWKHKVLWIFGIFAGCGRGNTSFNGNSSGGGDGGFGAPDLPPEVVRVLQTIEQNLTTFIIVGLIVILLIWAVTIYISAMGKVSLIRGTFQADGDVEHLIFGQLFSESTPYFWRVFGINLLVSLPGLILVLAAVGTAIFVVLSGFAEGDVRGVIATMIDASLILIPCACCLLPVLFVVGLIVRQAENAIVLEDMRVLPSLSRAWDVIRNNLGPIILMTIILGVIGLVASFVIAIPIFVIAVPAFFAFIAGEGQSWTPLIIMGVLLCLYIPVSIVLQGIATAYSESAWTLTYMRLTRPQDNMPEIVEANA